MSQSLSISLPDQSATDRFGAQLAAAIPPGTVIALDGTLGAGKTRLVQAIGKAVGIDSATITSPTFTLVHQYPFTREEQVGKKITRTIYHLDAYRVRDPEEFWELGVEEMFESDGWTIIEWAERVKACLPQDYLQITLEVIGENERKVLLETTSSLYLPFIANLTT